jgi:hypothetical protein
MAGSTDGMRDALTRFTRPVSGAYYYFVPSAESPLAAGRFSDQRLDP